MRIHLKYNSMSICEVMGLCGKLEGRDYLVVRGEIMHPLTAEGAGVQPFSVELGVVEPEVGQEAIDSFFAQPDVQEQLRALLEMTWDLERKMADALGQDQVATTARLALELLRMDRKREGG